MVETRYLKAELDGARAELYYFQSKIEALRPLMNDHDNRIANNLYNSCFEQFKMMDDMEVRRKDGTKD